MGISSNEKYLISVVSIFSINSPPITLHNTNKTFHPKENGWVGYIITLDDIRYYIAGDTDITEENRKLKWWDKSIEEINNLIPILISSDLEKVKEELSKLV